MTGYSDGVIGARSESIMQMFFGKRKNFVLTCGEGKYQFNAIVVKINQANQCESIIQLNILEKN
jgi:calcineurin-like phosphoesterase